MFTRILLATDGSDHALGAARSAATLARQFQATLIVVYVSTYPDTVTPFDGALGELSGAEAGSIPAHQAALTEARTAVHRTEAALTEDPSPLAYTVGEYIGDPADTLLSAARQEKADLIVMGSSGIGGFQRFFLGSVSGKVAREAHCSVLIVRDGEEDEEKEKQ